MIISIALLAGYFWNYEYTIEELYYYIKQLRPIVDLDQDCEEVRRVEGSQQSGRKGYLQAGVPA